MKISAKRIVSALLASLLLLTAVACTTDGTVTGDTTAADTSAEGTANDATTSDTTNGTEAPSETEEVTLPAPEDYEITENGGSASVVTPMGQTGRDSEKLRQRLSL